MCYDLQARGQALSKQLSDTHEQVEQSVVELETFKKLQSLERMAMPKRFQVCFETIDRVSYSRAGVWGLGSGVSPAYISNHTYFNMYKHLSHQNQPQRA